MKSPSQSDPWIGKLIGDRQRYRLDKRIGAGGMGEVFLAMDTVLGQEVALKLLKGTLLTSDELRKRFEREVAVSAALKNEHIVKVSDYGVSTEGYPFYVMEYLRGQSLGQLMRSVGQLPIERTINIVTQVCDGLRLAHQGVTLWRNNATVSEHIKVVHRDLKPDNIYLVPTSLGELVKILDFGIAKIREGTAEHTQLTQMFLGTYHYASPEQLEVDTGIDGRADIYSLGIIFYEMLSGTDPFGLGLSTRKINEITWAMAHTATPPQSLRQHPHLSGLQPELEAVVMRCLEKTPARRFASVDELKQAMLAAVAVTHPQPSPTTTSTPGSSEPTIARPSPQQPIISAPPITQTSSEERFSNNSTIYQPLSPPEIEISAAILSLEKDSLLEIFAEIIGPIAQTLIQDISAQVQGNKELVENLVLYLSPQQRTELNKKAILLLKKATPTQSRFTNSSTLKKPAINAKFLQHCQDDLAEIIGPIASALIQEILQSHPQISPVELVNILASEITDPKKAKEFSVRLLKLIN